MAESSGQLLQGDQIISVNSLDLEKATQVLLINKGTTVNTYFLVNETNSF